MHQPPRTVVITGFGHDLALKLARRGARIYATMPAPDDRNADVARSRGDG